ncbi:MAG: ISAs1 family transposase [Candidatus Competibacteraceae bacterium]
MVVRSQSTVEPAVLPPLTPVAGAVRQVLCEQPIPVREKVVPLQPVEQRSPLARLSDHVDSLPDPREAGLIEHKLLDIITIAICAVICGADSWVEIEAFGKAQYEWLRGFLELPNGIPSHDTFGRVLARLSAVAFQRCFASWIQTVFTVTQGQVIAVDGKTLRRSYDRGAGKAAIPIVSAWASANRLVLGQVKTDDKSNAITAIPERLKLLDLKGGIVTIDAMGCQRAIAAQIIAQEGDSVLALKGNQGGLYEDVCTFFDAAQARQCNGIPHRYHQTVDGDHGRVEVRRYWTVDQIDWLADRPKEKELKLIGMVESERQRGDSVTVERRYYLASLADDAVRFGHAVRSHWSIENPLHGSLDVTFNEDACRVRQGETAENFAVLRHIALSLLRQEKTAKGGLKTKRFKAALEIDYLYKC